MRSVIAILVITLLAACSTENSHKRDRARELLRSYGCGSCHVIPGVPGANGRVGPSLAGIARRGYIGGVLPNTPENMTHWIRDPQTVDPRTAMPNTGVTEQDASAIADYLYTLE